MVVTLVRSTKLLYTRPSWYYGGSPYLGSTTGNLPWSDQPPRPGQLSLAIPPWVGATSTDQRAVIHRGWGVKAGMARVSWQVKLCDPCITRVIPEHFRGCYGYLIRFMQFERLLWQFEGLLEQFERLLVQFEGIVWQCMGRLC